jgi:hypothetical protein
MDKKFLRFARRTKDKQIREKELKLKIVMAERERVFAAFKHVCFTRVFSCKELFPSKKKEVTRESI